VQRLSHRPPDTDNGLVEEDKEGRVTRSPYHSDVTAMPAHRTFSVHNTPKGGYEMGGPV